jgi:hypothetical protein
VGCCDGCFGRGVHDKDCGKHSLRFRQACRGNRPRAIGCQGLRAVAGVSRRLRLCNDSGVATPQIKGI